MDRLISESMPIDAKSTIVETSSRSTHISSAIVVRMVSDNSLLSTGDVVPELGPVSV